MGKLVNRTCGDQDAREAGDWATYWRLQPGTLRALRAPLGEDWIRSQGPDAEHPPVVNLTI